MAVSVHPSCCVCTSKLLCLYIQVVVSVHPSCCVCTSKLLCLYIQVVVSVHPSTITGTSACVILVFKARMAALMLIFYLPLRSYDDSMHIEDLLPANLRLVILLSFEHVRNLKDSTATRSNGKQNIQFQNKNLLAIMPRRAEFTVTLFDV